MKSDYEMRAMEKRMDAAYNKTILAMKKFDATMDKFNSAAMLGLGKIPTDAQWEFTRAILPHLCYSSKKILWPFTKAYQGTKYFVSPMGVAHRRINWLSKEEYTFLKLKGDL